MTKNMIIIGAGIAGLSTGCYAQMNGYKSKIFEMHNRAGGVCTSWKRKEYTFDHCIHNLAGTGIQSGLRQVWDELGALIGTSVIDHDLFVRVEGSKGETVSLYTDLDRLEKHLKGVAPEDSDIIEQYIKAARSFVNFDFFAMPLGGIKRKFGMLTHLRGVMKWSKLTLPDFARRFSNPFLRKAFSHFQYNIDGHYVPMLVHLVFLAGLHSGDLGWPKGGSLEFSRRIEKRYLDLGGEVYYKSRVLKIIVEDGRAVGVQLADGTEHLADIIISAADGYDTIFRMLDGKFTNKLIRSYYEAFDESQDFGLTVHMGLNRNLSTEPHAITLLLDKPLVIEGEERDSLYLELFTDETGLASEGKSIIKVVTTGNYEYWKKKRGNLEDYRAEKNSVSETIITHLEKRFPGIKEQVEVVDVTTPVTAERFTNNFHGWQPWEPRVEADKIMRKGLSKTLPGLQNFYMVGHWAGAMIGVSTVALMGRSLIRDICKRDKKKFVTSVSAAR